MFEEKMGRGKQEIVKGGLKYAKWVWTSAQVFANSLIVETQGLDRGIKIHRAHSNPRNPIGYLLCHMGNNGLHNQNVELRPPCSPPHFPTTLKLKT